MPRKERMNGARWGGLWVKLAGLALGATIALGGPQAPPRLARAEPVLGRRTNPLEATSSAAARQDALRSIPFDKLDAQAQSRVARVLSDVSFFRRMPTRVIQCDPDLYLFLVQHPDVVVNIWEVMGLTQMAIRQHGPGLYGVADVAGTKGTAEYLYSSHDTHLIYTEGAYEGRLFARPIRGSGLILLKSGYVRETDGRYYVTCRMDAFMRVDHVGADLLARTFHPLVGKVADINFTQTAGFFGTLSRTAEVDRDGVRRLAARLNHVEPEVRDRFAQIAEQVARKTAQREKPPTEGPVLVAARPAEDEAP